MLCFSQDTWMQARETNLVNLKPRLRYEAGGKDQAARTGRDQGEAEGVGLGTIKNSNNLIVCLFFCY